MSEAWNLQRELRWAHEIASIMDEANERGVRELLERGVLTEWFIEQQPVLERAWWKLSTRSSRLARLMMTRRMAKSAAMLHEFLRFAHDEHGLG